MILYSCWKLLAVHVQLIHDGISGCFNKKFQLKFLFSTRTSLIPPILWETQMQLISFMELHPVIVNTLPVVVTIMEDESEFLSSFLCFSCVLDFTQNIAFYRINFPGHHLFHLITWVLSDSQIFVVVIYFFKRCNPITTSLTSALFFKNQNKLWSSLSNYESIKSLLGCFETRLQVLSPAWRRENILLSASQ